MNKPIVLVDVFRDIVSAVSDKLTVSLQEVDPLINGVHYQHGHPLEIIQNLQELSAGITTKTSRFPLIALFQDFPENIGVDDGYYGDVRLHLIIARSTDENFKAGKRYDVNFKPILYPIYESFLEELKLSRRFSSYSGIFQHTKIDRLFWGKEGLYGNEGNVFNDKIDCIEIKDLQLKVKQQRC